MGGPRSYSTLDSRTRSDSSAVATLLCPSFPRLITPLLLLRLQAIPRPQGCHHHPELHLGLVSGWERRPAPRGCHANAAVPSGCSADSVYNPERIGLLSVTTRIFRADGPSRPWGYIRTLCKRLQRIFRPAGAANDVGRREARDPRPVG